MNKIAHNRITEEQKQVAIEAYARSGNLSIAAKAAGVSRWTLWNEGKRNAKFRKALDNSKGSYTDTLEAILDRRIVDGYEKGDKASAILLMFKLKAEMPEKYREHIDHKIEGEFVFVSHIPRPEQKQIEIKTE